jgi:AcrR family transcriptional regulator
VTLDTSIRTRKRDWIRGQIVDAAWELARRDGMAAVSLRELAATVGMRAPSLYHYFPSKEALYDAMYAQGMQQLADRIQSSPPGRNASETLRNRARTFVTAAAEDPTRFELLFHRPIPGFAPSPEHLVIGLTNLATTRQMAAAAGLRSERAFDLFMAVTHGLVAMQIANEPGGDRWIRLVDDAVDLLLAQHASGQRRAGRAARH